MSQPVRIPADVDREDTVVANLTAHQLLLLAGSGTVLYLLWTLTRAFVPVLVFLVGAVPVAAVSAYVALGRRDGLPVDQFLLAALRQQFAPRYQVAAPEGVLPAPAWLTARADTPTTGSRQRAISPGPMRMPVDGVRETGVIDLGADGLAAVAVCGTVNFALRTPTEQEALVASFARYLHSLTAPVQILIRAERLDLAGQIEELRAQAPALPHPALEAAAREHADHLVHLAGSTVLLRRQVLVVLREPLRSAAPADGLGSGTSPFAVLAQRRSTRTLRPVGEAAIRAAEARLARRLAETADLLAPAGITVTALDAAQATAVLASACNPDNVLPRAPELAAADDVITTGSADDANWFTPQPDAEPGNEEPEDDGEPWFDQHGWTTAS